MSEKQAFKEPNRLMSLKEISPSLYYDAEMYDCQRKPDGVTFFKALAGLDQPRAVPAFNPLQIGHHLKC